jgi:large subunit ribosomal protein L22
MKRVRPAPMGRAFRVVKRTTHLTVAVSEKPIKVAPVAATADGGKAKASKKKAAPATKADKE